MSRGQCPISGEGFWCDVILRAGLSSTFSAKANCLRNLRIRLAIGANAHVLEIHRDRIYLLAKTLPEAVSIQIEGPEDEWQRLICGETVYAQAINVHHGRLRVSGDAVATAWATPALWELFRHAAAAYRDQVPDA